MITLRAETDDAGRRLDRILRKALPELPLSALHRLLRQGRVLVEGRPAKGGEKILAGARISLPAGEGLSPAPAHGRSALGKKGEARRPPPPLPPILFEGAGLLILNKPAGRPVHGEGGLEGAVRAYLAPRLPPSLSFRPGPLHRLDRPTSGILVFSGSLEGARIFSTLLREGRIKKYYLALVEGRLPDAEVWEDELLRDWEARKTFTRPGGPSSRTVPGPPNAGRERTKTALTRVRPLAKVPGYTLLLAEISTGRTHQIRAQAAAHGHPLAGDRKYGGGFQPGGFFLHAWKLELGDAAESFPGLLPPLLTAPLPAAFKLRIEGLLAGGASWETY